MRFAWLLAAAMAWAQWTPQTSNTTASLRGVMAVSETVAWASGTQGTYLRTIDGGKIWQAKQVPGAETLDFRDLHAFDANRAVLMSVGPGPASRIYRTGDGGEHWTLLLRNAEPKGFFDAIAFWDARRGIVVGDAVNGRMYAATTTDGGTTWIPVEPSRMPPSREGEGAFAASGTCVFVRSGGLAWMATGGTGGSRVFRSADWGKSWQVSETPLRHEDASAGIFSIAFRDSRHGVVVGGNYAKPGEDRDNVAFTTDGGKTWTAPAHRPRGFRSAAAYVPGGAEVIAAGTTGIDSSYENGRSWKPLSDGNFNALSFATPKVAWAVGPKGAIAKLSAGR